MRKPARFERVRLNQRNAAHTSWKVFAADQPSFACDRGHLQYVLELADITGPLVGAQEIHGIRRNQELGAFQTLPQAVENRHR